MWLKSQSVALSTLLSQFLSAFMHFFSGKPMDVIIAIDSAGGPSELPPAPAAFLTVSGP